jgi:hypothetical protein
VNVITRRGVSRATRISYSREHTLSIKSSFDNTAHKIQIQQRYKIILVQLNVSRTYEEERTVACKTEREEGVGAYSTGGAEASTEGTVIRQLEALSLN